MCTVCLEVIHTLRALDKPSIASKHLPVQSIHFNYTEKKKKLILHSIFNSLDCGLELLSFTFNFLRTLGLSRNIVLALLSTLISPIILFFQYCHFT